MGEEDEKQQPLYRRVLNGLNVFEQIRRARESRIDKIDLRVASKKEGELSVLFPPFEQVKELNFGSEGHASVVVSEYSEDEEYDPKELKEASQTFETLNDEFDDLRKEGFFCCFEPEAVLPEEQSEAAASVRDDCKSINEDNTTHNSQKKKRSLMSLFKRSLFSKKGKAQKHDSLLELPGSENPIKWNTDKPKGRYLDHGYTPPENLEQGAASLSKRSKPLVQKSKSQKNNEASGSPKKWSFGSSLSVDSVTKNTSKSAKERQIAAQPFLALMKVTNGNPMSILKGTKEGDDAKKKKRRKKKRKPKNSNIS